jgi:hypothetical protein
MTSSLAIATVREQWRPLHRPGVIRRENYCNGFSVTLLVCRGTILFFYHCWADLLGYQSSYQAVITAGNIRTLIILRAVLRNTTTAAA